MTNFSQIAGASALVCKGGSYREARLYCLWSATDLLYTGDVYINHGSGYAKCGGYGDTSIKGLKVVAYYGCGVEFAGSSMKPYVKL